MKWPGTDIEKSMDNEFNWNTGSSSFVKGRHFAATPSGMTAAQSASKSREEAEVSGGRHRATMVGLSPKADKRLREDFTKLVSLHVYKRGKKLSIK